MAPQKDTEASQAAPQSPARGEATHRASPSARLIDGLAERGFAVVDGLLALPLVAELRARAAELSTAGALHPARIGRGAQERRASDVRGDFIAWLEEPQLDAEQQLLARVEALRLEMNRELAAGLVEFEGHFAVYPPGAAYTRHSDRPSGSDARAISFVLYLNDAWSSDDGGALRIYDETGGFIDVLPAGGRAVAFQSERFEHEVRPARRERLSFTGWFRRRTLDELA